MKKWDLNQYWGRASNKLQNWNGRPIQNAFVCAIVP